MSPDSDVIGTNYDGTTAGKKRQSARNPRSPRNSLDRPAGVALAGSILACWACRFAARASTTERVVVNRFTGLAIEGFDPVAYFVDAAPERRPAGIRGLRGRRGLAFPQRGQSRLLCRPSGDLRSPVRRLRPDRCRPRRHRCRQSPVLAGRRANGFICSAARRTGTPLPPIRRAAAEANAALAGAGAELADRMEAQTVIGERVGQVSSICAAAGSPQAMNSGTINPSGPRPNARRRPVASVILPPAAVTTAWPAAISHSQVGASRG